MENQRADNKIKAFRAESKMFYRRFNKSNSFVFCFFAGCFKHFSADVNSDNMLCAVLHEMSA